MTDFEALQLIAEDDQIWFAQHPYRLLRLRYATDGDWTGAAADQLILVFCPVEGLCVRLDCRLAPELGPEYLREIDSDALLLRPLLGIIETLKPEKRTGLWRMLDAALKQGKRLQSLSEIQRTRDRHDGLPRSGGEPRPCRSCDHDGLARDTRGGGGLRSGHAALLCRN